MAPDAITGRLGALRDEHRELDARILALSGELTCDQVEIARLKKRKLRIRDEIESLRDLLLPDIIA
jgi:hypothetical protein